MYVCISGHTAPIAKAGMLDPIRNMFSPVRSRPQSRQDLGKWFSRIRANGASLDSIDTADFDRNFATITADHGHGQIEFDSYQNQGYKPDDKILMFNKNADTQIKSTPDRPKLHMKCKPKENKPKRPKKPPKCKKVNPAIILSNEELQSNSLHHLKLPSDRLSNSRLPFDRPYNLKLPSDDPLGLFDSPNNSRLPSDGPSGLLSEGPYNFELSPYNSELPSNEP